MVYVVLRRSAAGVTPICCTVTSGGVLGDEEWGMCRCDGLICKTVYVGVGGCVHVH